MELQFQQIMEELQPKRNDKQAQHVQKKCSFTEEIEKVQINRQKALNELLRSKKQQKQNIHNYLTKKLIIPLSLSTESFESYSPGIILRKRNSNYNQLVSKIDTFHENKENTQQKKNCNKRASENLILEKRLNQRWKLEITPEQMNSLFFGKELRIGSKSRQFFLSDDKIRQLKSTSLFRTKLKSKQIRSYEANSLKSPKNQKAHEDLQTPLKFRSLNQKQAQKQLSCKQFVIKRKCSHHLISFESGMSSQKRNKHN